jgi:hypothetical protein
VRKAKASATVVKELEKRNTLQELFKQDQLGTDHLTDSHSTRQAVGGTLTDQHGNLVYYEIRLNRKEFDFIVDDNNRLYDANQQTKDVTFDFGSMEVKAAWREMTAKDTPEIRKRFFIDRAWVYSQDEATHKITCELKEMGLIGLHISQKTPSRPQWVWATFEHVDNAPYKDDVPKAAAKRAETTPYSLYDPNCNKDQHVAHCKWNTSTEDKHHNPTEVPTQVVRIIKIDPETQTLNHSWQTRLSDAVSTSPWQYYQLVNTQWPRNRFPTPSNVSNTTMETYLQESGCMFCHSKARTVHGHNADYSYVLLEAKSGAHSGR